MRQLRNAWLVGFILVLVGLAIPAAVVLAEPQAAVESAPWTIVHERWYVMEIDGKAAGWSHELAETNGSQFRSTSAFKMSVARGPQTIQAEVSSEFLESSGGEPISITYRQKLGMDGMERLWTFGPEGVAQVERAGGQELTRTLPLPAGDWLTPMEVERFLNERRAAGAKEITFTTIMPEAGIDPVDVKTVLDGKAETTFDGRTLPVTIWKTVTSTMQMEAVEQITEDGFIARSEIQTPGLGAVVTRLTTKAEALAVEGGPAPELMLSTFVKTDRPIKDSEHSTKAMMKLKVKKGSMPAIPSAAAQRAVMGEDGASAMLTIDINSSAEETIDDAMRHDCLEPSMMINSDDAMVKKLAAHAVADVEVGGGAGGEMAKAEALRKFVHDDLTLKGLDTAFASASETARTKKGDCSEHAVLLCAMMRANGIPSRVATGLLYISHFGNDQNIFGWHMWTQGLIDGRWVDFDATLPRRYHACHVLTGVTSLNEGVAGSEFVSMLSLIGNLQIEVVEVKSD